MKIGIISDSHDHHVNILKAVEVFRDKRPDYIFHAGDIISPFAARVFAEVEGARFRAVFGNNDGEKLLLKGVITDFGGQICEGPYRCEVKGKKICMMHRLSDLEEIVSDGRYDVVIYGHTHKKDIRQVADTLVINPGETTDWLTDESSVVLLELDDMSTEVISLR